MPTSPEFDVNKILDTAVVLHRQGRVVEAERLYRAILEHRPGHGLVNYHLGLIRQSEGRFDEAGARFGRTIQHFPLDGRAHFALARCKKYEPGDLHTALMERILDSGRLDASNRVLIDFALAKVYNDIGDAARAFARCRAANEAQAPPYDAKSYHEFLNRVMAVFDGDFFAAHANLGSVSQKYVFVVGLPRTGTTLVDQIASSHPEVHSAGEPLFFVNASESMQEFVKRGEPYPECLRDAAKPGLQYLIESYHVMFRGVPERFTRVTNKFPENFRVLGLIGLLFPRSRVIECTRDPLDSGLSIYFQNLPVAKHAYSCRLEDIGHYTLEYRRLMAHWRAVLPVRWHQAPYESMIADRETETRKLIDFLGLEWDARCLEFQRNETRVTTESVWQVRQPVYTTSVARWKKYETQLEPLKRVLDAGLAPDGTIAL
jgi:tetratricopeptide (TPR) repeat protein